MCLLSDDWASGQAASRTAWLASARQLCPSQHLLLTRDVELQGRARQWALDLAWRSKLSCQPASVAQAHQISSSQLLLFWSWLGWASQWELSKFWNSNICPMLSHVSLKVSSCNSWVKNSGKSCLALIFELSNPRITIQQAKKTIQGC